MLHSLSPVSMKNSDPAAPARRNHHTLPTHKPSPDLFLKMLSLADLDILEHVLCAILKVYIL